MADVWYDKALTKMGKGQIDLVNNTIIAIALTSAHAFSQSDEFIGDLSGIVGRTAGLTGKTVGVTAEGVFDADDSSFSSLTGSTVTQLVFAKDTGNDATSPVLFQADNTKYTGLPFTPTGVDVPLIFPAAGIAKV